MEIAKLAGTVTPFKGNGRQFGYPTANITSNTALADGVYFGYANLADYHLQPTLIFIGVPETVGDTQRRVEAYLLDIPDQDYYGLQLEITLAHYHRPNQRFDTVAELLSVMAADDMAGRQWFAKNNQSADT